MVRIAPFGVEAWLNKWEKQARYDISQSTIASLTLDELFSLTGDKAATVLAPAVTEKQNYGWIEGSPAFKRAVASLYQRVPAENVLQTNGATGANLLALTALVEPGDQVIAEYPSYQQLYDIPRSLGAKISYWRIHEEDQWYPDLAELARLIKPTTKLICLNNANNPTGTVLDRVFLEKVVELARSVGAYVLIDEVYQPLAAQTTLTPIADLYERGISTNSLSKTYSLPGLRIGWVATADPALTDRLRSFRDYTMICGGVFNDRLATYALEHRAAILNRNRQLVQANLATYREWVAQEDRVRLVAPQAVSTSFPRLLISEDTTSFCLKLLQEEGVLLVPGEAFDTPGHVRLGYCAPTAVLTEGLERLSRFLHRQD